MVPCSGRGTGAASASQGGPADEQDAQLPADRYLLLAQQYSRPILGAVGEGTPKSAQGPCLAPGFLGALPQPQEFPPPTPRLPRPPGMFG